MELLPQGWLHGFILKLGAIQNSESEHTVVISITLIVSLLGVCTVIDHLFENNRFINQATIAILLGCFTGFIIYVATSKSELLTFDEQMFFIYLLPPIIFNAGFQVKKKQFFHNFGTIMLFGGIGVFISTAIVTAGCRYLFPRLRIGSLEMKDYLAMGIIFSATDTVATLQILHQDETPLLYSVVFGEGVVNDATSVVLFRAVQKFGEAGFNGRTALNMVAGFCYLFTLSTILGVAIGLITAYVLKTLYFGRHSTDREISIMALMAYLSYMLAELFHLSGILSVFFCGILMSHYSWHNVSESSQITTKHAFATLSFISESFMFLYVGTDVFNVNIWKLVNGRDSILLSAWLLALIPLGRAAFVFPFSLISNCARGSSSASLLTFRHQVIIWWAGMMRGAVSIALAYQQFTSTSGAVRDSSYATMVFSTSIVVIFTTVGLGIFTKPLIEKLLPHHLRVELLSKQAEHEDRDRDHYMQLSSEGIDGDGEESNMRRRSSLSLLLANPTSAVHSFWRSFDDLYMRPIFGGGGFVRDTNTWDA